MSACSSAASAESEQQVGPLDDGSQKRWYVIYLRSRFEKKVHEELLRHGVESFQPLIWEVRKWSDRKKKVEVPLFPGYNFVRIDLKNRVRVLEVEGVVKFVAIRNHPTPVPDEQIGWIRQLLGAPATLRKEPTVATGQIVEVTGGPFAGVRGVVVQQKNSTRVVIAIESIAQAVSVEVQAAMLKQVAEKNRE